ncbi:MAG TPA: cyclomaltodextrinase C-terminal domain-containing protein, partial [Burkholderiaceae bacterium]|nr:cyclomaltodextrinase C-terminal domain-containing protein [Burkholderiaceae bacterium]
RFHEVLAAQSSGTDVLSGKSFDLSHSLTVPARSVLILEVK